VSKPGWPLIYCRSKVFSGSVGSGPFSILDFPWLIISGWWFSKSVLINPLELDKNYPFSHLFTFQVAIRQNKLLKSHHCSHYVVLVLEARSILNVSYTHGFQSYQALPTLLSLKCFWETDRFRSKFWPASSQVIFLLLRWDQPPPDLKNFSKKPPKFSTFLPSVKKSHWVGTKNIRVSPLFTGGGVEAGSALIYWGFRSMFFLSQVRAHHYHEARNFYCWGNPGSRLHGNL